MSLSTRRGCVNAAQSVLLKLLAEMPAKLTTSNASQYVQFMANLPGSYVIPTGGKTLIVTLDNAASAFTGTIAAGTYTATQMAAAINALSGISAYGLSSTTTCNGNHVVVRKSTANTDGKLTIGAGTINSYFGRASGEVFSGRPLPSIAWARVGSLDAPVLALPAVTVSMPGFTVDDDMKRYTCTVRFRTGALQFTAECVDQAHAEAAEYADLATQILDDASSLFSNTDGHTVIGGQPIDLYADENAANIHGSVDLTVAVNVEED